MRALYLIPRSPRAGSGSVVEELWGLELEPWPLRWLVHHYGGSGTSERRVQIGLVVELWNMWSSCISLWQGIAWVIGSGNTGHSVIN